MMGTDVIVLDPENEYRALVDTVGGSYINISLNSNEKINPLFFDDSTYSVVSPGAIGC